ncbi:biotin synthase [Pseudorhodoferax sp. LjRoot39]|uniref:class I SAM-dependent methyltransferase n=1 Tax=Pseudorhodoferax sp. LjRoot39 TaxID=3342328 RepID=UPI003ECE6210
MSQHRPPTIAPVAAARWAQQPVQSAPWLHDEVARRMAERLQWIKRSPTSWAHWQALRGGMAVHAELRKRYLGAENWVVESVPTLARQVLDASVEAWWKPGRWSAAAQHAGMPPAGSVQMVWSNMLLHQVADPQALIADWHRALAVDGFLMFSCLGPDSLLELRRVYAALGWPPPGHAFTDMHDWGDMLVQAGFAEPIMDMERIRLTYATPDKLLEDLRGLGRNLHPGRFGALRGRKWHAQLRAELARQLADPAEQGRLTLTFEIVYGHAFRPAARVPVAAQSAVSLEDMRGLLRHGKGEGQ